MSQGEPDPEDQEIAESQPDDFQDDSDLERGQGGRVIAAWRGPLPPPSVLRQYDDVIPGSAMGIYQRWEKQSDHRMRMESQAESHRIQRENHQMQMESQMANHQMRMERISVIGGSIRAYMGLIFAFVLSLAIIGGGTYIAISVNPGIGTVAIGVGVAALAGVFVYGTNSRRREREQKAADARSD